MNTLWLSNTCSVVRHPQTLPRLQSIIVLPSTSNHSPVTLVLKVKVSTSQREIHEVVTRVQSYQRLDQYRLPHLHGHRPLIIERNQTTQIVNISKKLVKLYFNQFHTDTKKGPSMHRTLRKSCVSFRFKADNFNNIFVG